MRERPFRKIGGEEPQLSGFSQFLAHLRQQFNPIRVPLDFEVPHARRGYNPHKPRIVSIQTGKVLPVETYHLSQKLLRQEVSLVFAQLAQHPLGLFTLKSLITIDSGEYKLARLVGAVYGIETSEVTQGLLDFDRVREFSRYPERGKVFITEHRKEYPYKLPRYRWPVSSSETNLPYVVPNSFWGHVFEGVKVAVIGGGPAGQFTSLILRRIGLGSNVTIFDPGSSMGSYPLENGGGTWRNKHVRHGGHNLPHDITMCGAVLGISHNYHSGIQNFFSSLSEKLFSTNRGSPRWIRAQVKAVLERDTTFSQSFFNSWGVMYGSSTPQSDLFDIVFVCSGNQEPKPLRPEGKISLEGFDRNTGILLRRWEEQLVPTPPLHGAIPPKVLERLIRLAENPPLIIGLGNSTLALLKEIRAANVILTQYSREIHPVVLTHHPEEMLLEPFTFFFDEASGRAWRVARHPANLSGLALDLVNDYAIFSHALHRGWLWSGVTSCNLSTLTFTHHSEGISRIQNFAKPSEVWGLIGYRSKPEFLRKCSFALDTSERVQYDQFSGLPLTVRPNRDSGTLELFQTVGLEVVGTAGEGSPPERKRGGMPETIALLPDVILRQLLLYYGKACLSEAYSSSPSSRILDSKAARQRHREFWKEIAFEGVDSKK